MRAFLLVSVAWLCAMPCVAQEDVRAGLFAEARQLPLVEQSAHVSVAGGEVLLHLEQVYANDGDAVAQADYRLPLPRGAALAQFGFEKAGEMLWAKLERKEQAEAEHREAAAEGRTTGLAGERDGAIHFSVYPLAAGERKRIALRLRLPVTYEMGQGRVRLPLDAVAGRSCPETPVLVDLNAEGPLLEWGADDAEVRALRVSGRNARLSFSASHPVELWWLEEGPPLSMRARAMAVDDGLALAFELHLRDAESWAQHIERVHVLIDASYSMGKRREELALLVDRVRSRAPSPVSLWAVAEARTALDAGLPAPTLLEPLTAGELGHRATAADFARALDELGCARPELRCAVVSDGQLEGVREVALAADVILLSDAEEEDFAASRGGYPEGVSRYRTGADSRGVLWSQADALVLPTIVVDEVHLGGVAVAWLDAGAMKTAEGGSVRAHAMLDHVGPLEVHAHIGERAIVEKLEIEDLGPDDPRAGALRYAVYRAQLAAWMKDYRAAPDDALEERITEVSLREGIPTAFTALQVDDPELSLFAIKPGDPLLRVSAEPGLERVVAYYPFGEARELSLDGEDFIDRFLVPRNWPDRSYRIQIFKRYAGGRVAQVSATYVLDDRGLDVLASIDEARGQLVVDAGALVGDVARVEVHGGDGGVRVLTPVETQFRTSLEGLGPRFDVFVRDRAGNRTRLRCHVVDGVLELAAEAPPHTPLTLSEAPMADLRRADGVGLSIRAGELQVQTDRGLLRADARAAALHSLVMTAHTEAADGSIWLGTAGGDLVSLRECDAEGRCRVDVHGAASWLAHPVTGLVALPDGRMLASLLGLGVYEGDDAGFERSSLRFGTRAVSAMLRVDDEVLVGTHTRGLWRILPGPRGLRAVRSRFGPRHVAALRQESVRVVVESGYGNFVRRGRDRFAPTASTRIAAAQPASLRFTASARFAERTVLASFDRGLYRVDRDAPGGVAAWDTDLAGRGRHVNALVAFDDLLYVGSEAGLFAMDATGRSTRLLSTAVHGFALGPDRLAIASSEGLFVLYGDGPPRRLDGQGAPSARFTAVAYYDGALYAGGLDGLVRFDDDGEGEVRAIGAAEGFDAAWVTSLATHAGALYVGTYASGVRRLDAHGVGVVAGLESQWVPPGGLRADADGLWVGGLGMALRRLVAGEAHVLPLPTLDVYGTANGAGGVWVFGSEGTLEIRTSGKAPSPHPGRSIVSARLGQRESKSGLVGQKPRQSP